MGDHKFHEKEGYIKILQEQLRSPVKTAVKKKYKKVLRKNEKHSKIKTHIMISLLIAGINNRES